MAEDPCCGEEWRLGRLLTREPCWNGVPVVVAIVTIRPTDDLGAVRVREAEAHHRDPRWCWVEIVKLGGIGDA